MERARVAEEAARRAKEEADEAWSAARRAKGRTSREKAVNAAEEADAKARADACRQACGEATFAYGALLAQWSAAMGVAYPTRVLV